MMWNWQLSALASGVELVLYDGPLEGPDTFWRIVAEERVTVFGTNPAYLDFCEKAGLSPGRMFDLSALRAVLSTGSILYPRQYDWVGGQVKAMMPLQSISGGTDIIGCFVLGNPNLPVHRGEAQCRSLGLDVRSLPPPDDPEARIGELVCANPFPSRPLGFHGDADGTRFHAAYFAQNPGFWTHGDLIEATPHGGWRLHGRSDGVLNVRGIRIGTAEIYRILADIEEIREAMAVEQQAEEEAGGSRMVLLVVLRDGLVLGNTLAKHIRSELARCGSPAFVPARIAQVAALPVTFSGKRSEAAARDAVNGRPVRNRDAMQNPECLEAIAKHPVLRAPAASRTSRAPAPGRGEISDGDGLRGQLQAICERVLGVSPIGWSDNLLGFGADSLAVVNLLLEIEGYAGHPLPLSALLSAPSIEGLATALSVGAEMTAVAPRARTSFQTLTRAKYHAADILLWLLKSRQRPAAEQAGSANLYEHVPIPAKQREARFSDCESVARLKESGDSRKTTRRTGAGSGNKILRWPLPNRNPAWDGCWRPRRELLGTWEAFRRSTNLEAERWLLRPPQAWWSNQHTARAVSSCWIRSIGNEMLTSL